MRFVSRRGLLDTVKKHTGYAEGGRSVFFLFRSPFGNDFVAIFNVFGHFFPIDPLLRQGEKLQSYGL